MAHQPDGPPALCRDGDVRRVFQSSRKEKKRSSRQGRRNSEFLISFSSSPFLSPSFFPGEWRLQYYSRMRTACENEEWTYRYETNHG